MHNYKELKLWQKSRTLVTEVYKITSGFPEAELYGITSQLRRAVISIPTNIAEGCGRRSNKELKRFLDIVNGSAFELESLLILSSDLSFISETDMKELNAKVDEIQKMIFGFKKSISGLES